VSRDHRDVKARAEVIERYRAKYEDDLRNDGPMAAATEALAERNRMANAWGSCAGAGRNRAMAP
jgi:hypothetical protein